MPAGGQPAAGDPNAVELDIDDAENPQDVLDRDALDRATFINVFVQGIDACLKTHVPAKEMIALSALIATNPADFVEELKKKKMVMDDRWQSKKVLELPAGLQMDGVWRKCAEDLLKDTDQSQQDVVPPKAECV